MGPNLPKTISFLEEYLAFYKLNSSEDLKPDINIFYYEDEGILGSPRIPHWNFWEDQIILEKNTEWDVVIERDFVSKVSKDGSEVFAQGPTLSRMTCDSIDNLLVYVLGRFLLKKNAIILHAATVVDGNMAYVFFGPSGVGKSTLATHLYQTNNLKVISSDQVFLKIKNQELYAEAVPTTIPEFPLDHMAREKKAIKVKGIFYLTRSETKGYSLNKIKKVDFIQKLMQELMFRAEFGNADALLTLINNIVDHGKSFYEFSYRKDFNFFNELKEKI